jgi:hypothetical protein
MLYWAKVAVCSEINTKHINTVWKNVIFLNVKPLGASRNQQAIKQVILLRNGRRGRGISKYIEEGSTWISSASSGSRQ